MLSKESIRIFNMNPMPGERESVNDYFPEEVTPVQKGEVYFRQRNCRYKDPNAINYIKNKEKGRTVLYCISRM